MSSFPQFFLLDPDGTAPDILIEDISGKTVAPIPVKKDFSTQEQPLTCILIAEHGEAEESILRFRGQGHMGPLMIIRMVRDARRSAKLIDLGADDDLLLPLTPGEMRARIEAVERRSRQISGVPLDISGFRIFPDGRPPETGGREIPLSPHEAKIFEQLLRASGRFIPRSALYDTLYSLSNRAPSDSVIEVHICNIRRKLRLILPELKDRIETSRGRGYRFI